VEAPSRSTLHGADGTVRAEGAGECL